MDEQSFRTERDSMGEVKVPQGAYYSAQTQRSVENFPNSGIGFPPQLSHALGMVKSAAASANEQLGLLEPRIAGAIRHAAQEVIDGKLDGEFVDATPMCLGQEFSGYARQIELSIERIKAAASALAELPLGGTA